MHSRSPVVLMIDSLRGGGAERFVLTLAQAFSHLGYDTHIILFKDGGVDYALEENIHYHFFDYYPCAWLPRGALRQLSHAFRCRLNAWRLDAYIKWYIGKPGLILSNLLLVDQILRLSRFNVVTHVLHHALSAEIYTVYTDIAWQNRKMQETQRLYYGRRLVGVSQGVVDDYVNHIDPQARITAILNPVDQAKITALSQIEPKPYPFAYLIHVGRFSEQKDHATLIRAYAASAQTLPLVLVGKGEEEDNCRRLVQELGVAEQVIFAGFHANPYPLIAHATGFVLSSRYEGFGLVIAESLALGIPVISTDCPSGPNELLPSHCLVPVGNIAALSAKMDELMQSPEQFKVPFNEDLLPEKVAQRYLDWRDNKLFT